MASHSVMQTIHITPCALSAANDGLEDIVLALRDVADTHNVSYGDMYVPKAPLPTLTPTTPNLASNSPAQSASPTA